MAAEYEQQCCISVRLSGRQPIKVGAAADASEHLYAEEDWLCTSCNFRNLGGNHCAVATCCKSRQVMGVELSAVRRRSVPRRFGTLQDDCTRVAKRRRASSASALQKVSTRPNEASPISAVLLPKTARTEGMLSAIIVSIQQREQREPSSGQVPTNPTKLPRPSSVPSGLAHGVSRTCSPIRVRAPNPNELIAARSIIQRELTIARSAIHPIHSK